MKKSNSFLLYLIFSMSLVISFCGPLRLMAANGHPTPPNTVTVDTQLVQQKVLQGSDGKVSVSVTLNGADIPVTHRVEPHPVDLVVVLDRSGSMGGQKIHDARKAVIGLLERLSGRDRIALITYANNVHTVSGLVYVTPHTFNRLTRDVVRIQAGGGTNLGGGLQQAVDLLVRSYSKGRQRKIILISDGLANQGITDPYQLGAMASNGPEYNFTVNTVGVGYDFNELLMTTIADHGGGNYYFLEDPQSFASVFTKEFESSRRVVATGIEIHIHLNNHVNLLSSGGYPIERRGDTAIVRPGDLLSGQQRSFFLTYQVPTAKRQSISLGNMELRYTHDGDRKSVASDKNHSIDCVPDDKEVVASVDKATWSRQIIKEEYNKLKDDVATAVRSGKKAEALKSIEEYEEKTREMNKAVGSAEVSDNLDKDVSALKESVEDTFAGAPAAVMQKQKQQAKSLQYESYKARRDKK